MKKTILLPAVLILTALIALLAPIGCVETGTTPDTSSDTTADTRTDSELRAYYDTLFTALRDELSDVREEAYITRETLLLRIQALEAALESLDVTVPDPQPSETPPIETESVTAPESDTPAIGTDSPLDTTAPPMSEPASPFRYTVENGEATLIAYIADGTATVTVPATLGGRPVTRIGDNAFAGSEIERINLPATVTVIGWFAFAGCHDLTAITLPASVERIDYGAFDGCPNLTVHAPAGSYAAGYAASFGIPCVDA